MRYEKNKFGLDSEFALARARFLHVLAKQGLHVDKFGDGDENE